MTYVVLIRENKQFARNPPRLEDVERSQPLGNRQPVVQLTVNDLYDFEFSISTNTHTHDPHAVK